MPKMPVPASIAASRPMTPSALAAARAGNSALPIASGQLCTVIDASGAKPLRSRVPAASKYAGEIVSPYGASTELFSVNSVVPGGKTGIPRSPPVKGTLLAVLAQDHLGHHCALRLEAQRSVQRANHTADGDQRGRHEQRADRNLCAEQQAPQS